MNHLVTIATLFSFVYSVVMPVEVRAQERRVSEGNVYAAPGMMVKVGRSTVIPTAKPASITSPAILPRFWNGINSAKQAEYAIFTQELYR